MELKSQDVIEFGIDIIGDNGVIMYHKVACNVHIFPVPLSQVDDGIIKELSNHSQVQIFTDPHTVSLQVCYVMMGEGKKRAHVTFCCLAVDSEKFNIVHKYTFFCTNRSEWILHN